MAKYETMMVTTANLNICSKFCSVFRIILL